MAQVGKIIEGLNERPGFEPIAEQAQRLVSTALGRIERGEEGLPVREGRMHMVFEGNPGTGKTTAAKEYGKLYGALGLLPEPDKFVAVTSKELTGEYVNESRKKAQQTFDKARGGVLFVDEAYGLASNSYGEEALEQLLVNMENHKDDTVVIFAGYPKDIEKLFNVNSGLKSRVPTTITFPDYDEETLREIGNKYLKSLQYTLDKGAAGPLRAAIAQIAGSEGGNARGVEELMNKVLTVHDDRQREERSSGKPRSKRSLQTITAVDAIKGVSLWQNERR